MIDERDKDYMALIQRVKGLHVNGGQHVSLSMVTECAANLWCFYQPIRTMESHRITFLNELYKAEPIDTEATDIMHELIFFPVFHEGQEWQTSSNDNVKGAHWVDLVYFGTRVIKETIACILQLSLYTCTYLQQLRKIWEIVAWWTSVAFG